MQLKCSIVLINYIATGVVISIYLIHLLAIIISMNKYSNHDK